MNRSTVFLLSPANLGGRRAAWLFRPEANFPLATRLRDGGAPLGEVFAFVSGLYFRGKAAYAEAFARPPAGVSGALVISSGRGLLPMSTSVRLEDLAAFATVRVDVEEALYTAPLLRDADELAGRLDEKCRVVLLGSIATTKYVEVLLSVFGERLCFPEQFIGLGDMSRGSIMLRAAENGVELNYVSAAGAIRSRASSTRGDKKRK